ncbi:MAG TPA: hypothetical protein VGY77_00360 [Gemmataceae bacterium]|nr:hypothetical protein [Gemmataceae bacterium]
MPVILESRPLSERAFEVLRRAGNPFRNYFARNPDDEVCARYHVPDLFALERDQLLGAVDLYRNDPATHSEVVPVLGNKGAGKTHLLYSIKHGHDGGWQLLVTPGTYHKDTDFLEYLLFQMIDTLLGGTRQKGNRPLEVVGEELTRRLLKATLEPLTPTERLDLFPAPGLGRWARRLGLGSGQAQERTQWLLDQLDRNQGPDSRYRPATRRLLAESGITPQKACEMIFHHVERTETRNTAGLMRRNIHEGFTRAMLLSDESDLANFLTFGFAELEFQVRPTRQDLVMALFKVLMEVFLSLKIPVVVAFDQLEDLLLARRNDDGHRLAEAFFAGIVHAMHQIDGICFLVFAERGLWNRFVPSLDGYIQDRLNNPIHVPRHGTIKTLRLEAPSPDLLRQIVAARLRPSLEELPDFADLPPTFPFTQDQILRVARTEPTLRDMLQQFRHLFDHYVFGSGPNPSLDEETLQQNGTSVAPSRLPRENGPFTIKSLVVVESPDATPPGEKEQPAPGGADTEKQRESPDYSLAPVADGMSKTFESGFPPPRASIHDLWLQEVRSARRQLEPDGAMTGATRELQAGLGKFLQVCHDHGVKVGPWRLQHVVNELTFGEHPTYGVLTIAHWVCRDGQPWKVGIGLFLGRAAGKPKDLEIKLAAMDAEPAVIDHLILLRPEDDLALSGKSKTMWQDSARRGRHARLEPMSLDDYAMLYSFPRWLASITEALPEGQPLPNLADFLQDHCESLLERVCMPIQQ